MSRVNTVFKTNKTFKIRKYGRLSKEIRDLNPLPLETRQKHFIIVMFLVIISHNRILLPREKIILEELLEGNQKDLKVNLFYVGDARKIIDM